MRRVSITLLILLISLIPNAFSQDFNGFRYSALIKNNSNDIISDSEVGLNISILKGAENKEKIYSEIHTTTTNSNGVISIIIGNGESSLGEFSDINWGTDQYYLKVDVDFTNTSSFVEMGTSPLLTVPFAMYAYKAGSVQKNNSNTSNGMQDLQIDGNILKITNNPDATEIDLSDIKLTYLEEKLDAKADKRYVDEEIAEMKTHFYPRIELARNIEEKANKTDIYYNTDIDAFLALKADNDKTYTKGEIDSKLSTKILSENTYNKSTLDSKLTDKANSSDVYSKIAIDDSLALKANLSDTYKKTDLDNLLNDKADKTSVHTKSEADILFNTKVDTTEFNDFKNSKGAAGGLTPLNSSGVIDMSYMNSEVSTDIELQNAIDNLKDNVAEAGNTLNKLYTSIQGKEDQFTKNTAFNKNFGTANDEVARGDHSHTLTELGIAKVENKSSADIRGEITEGDIPELSASKITKDILSIDRINHTNSSDLPSDTTIFPTSGAVKNYVDNEIYKALGRTIKQGTTVNFTDYTIPNSTDGLDGFQFRPATAGKLVKMFVNISNNEWHNAPDNTLEFYIMKVSPNSNTTISEAKLLCSGNKSWYGINANNINSKSETYNHENGWNVNGDIYLDPSTDYIIYWKYSGGATNPIMVSGYKPGTEVFQNSDNQKSMGYLVNRVNGTTNSWSIVDTANGCRWIDTRIWIDF